ncbi:MAG: methylmalonyl Co-A mutase-associated GTPase MeaB [Saprospiraceae bacterium]|nr:methylmalonyl Co-A mutase-associated GTPase MeaB [Saprospiraceae bacterium]
MPRPLPSVTELADGIRRGDRVLLGRAITLVESTAPAHQAQAGELMAALQAYAPVQTFRVGITGSPGVGKSTFIEALGKHLAGQGQKVAVLAVDPTSQVSGGSILGDKTRMEQLSVDPLAFIRPSPAGDSLGGVARKTRETIALVEAAGYGVVLVETVGVGQSETAVHRMTDAFLLLLLPGAGDELQGIKRGIVEMADLLVVNKADGDRVQLANQARAHYLNALHLFPAKENGWTPRVLACSATEGTGIADVWATLETYKKTAQDNGFFDKNRQVQAHYWFRDALEQELRTAFYRHPAVQEKLNMLEEAVAAGRMSPFAAAREVLRVVFP